MSLELLAEQKRIRPTACEKKMLQFLTPETGWQFQIIMGNYIVDFYNHAEKLVIEIDGRRHLRTKDYDIERERFLRNEFHVRISRISNADIRNRLDWALRQVESSLMAKNPDPGFKIEREKQKQAKIEEEIDELLARPIKKKFGRPAV